MIDDILLQEFEATLALVRELREKVLAEPFAPTARGGPKLHPNAILLRDSGAQLARLARIITARKSGGDALTLDQELERLLD
jgi:hypothetical protein